MLSDVSDGLNNSALLRGKACDKRTVTVYVPEDEDKSVEKADTDRNPTELYPKWANDDAAGTAGNSPNGPSLAKEDDNAEAEVVGHCSEDNDSRGSDYEADEIVLGLDLGSKYTFEGYTLGMLVMNPELGTVGGLDYAVGICEELALGGAAEKEQELFSIIDHALDRAKTQLSRILDMQLGLELDTTNLAKLYVTFYGRDGGDKILCCSPKMGMGVLKFKNIFQDMELKMGGGKALVELGRARFRLVVFGDHAGHSDATSVSDSGCSNPGSHLDPGSQLTSHLNSDSHTASGCSCGYVSKSQPSIVYPTGVDRNLYDLTHLNSWRWGASRVEAIQVRIVPGTSAQQKRMILGDVAQRLKNLMGVGCAVRAYATVDDGSLLGAKMMEGCDVRDLNGGRLLAGLVRDEDLPAMGGVDGLLNRLTDIKFYVLAQALGEVSLEDMMAIYGAGVRYQAFLLQPPHGTPCKLYYETTIAFSGGIPRYAVNILITVASKAREELEEEEAREKKKKCGVGGGWRMGRALYIETLYKILKDLCRQFPNYDVVAFMHHMLFGGAPIQLKRMLLTSLTYQTFERALRGSDFYDGAKSGCEILFNLQATCILRIILIKPNTDDH
jgi:hypothetical protein